MLFYSSLQRPGQNPIIESHGMFDDAKGAHTMMKALAVGCMLLEKVKWRKPNQLSIECRLSDGSMWCYYYAEYKKEKNDAEFQIRNERNKICQSMN